MKERGYILIKSLGSILVGNILAATLLQTTLFGTELLCDHPCLLTPDSCCTVHLALKPFTQKDLCQAREILIFGPEVIEKYRHCYCKGQKRIFSGLLYPTLFFGEHLTAPFLSPLPGSSILKRYGRHFVTVYSHALEYYVSYLKKGLDLKAYRVKDLWHLEAPLTKALREKERLFLLLPDPLFVDRRGLKLLQLTLHEQKHPCILDLLGAPLPGEKVIKIPFPEREFCETLRHLLKTDLPAGIYFPEETRLTTNPSQSPTRAKQN